MDIYFIIWVIIHYCFIYLFFLLKLLQFCHGEFSVGFYVLLTYSCQCGLSFIFLKNFLNFLALQDAQAYLVDILPLFCNQ